MTKEIIRHLKNSLLGGQNHRKQQKLQIGYANRSDITALFELLGMLAKADGRVDPAHIKAVERFMDQQIPVTERPLAMASFRKGKEVTQLSKTVSSRAFELYGFNDSRWLEPIQIIDCMLRVALADGSFSNSEDYIIDAARATLGLHTRSYWILRDLLARKFGVELKKEFIFPGGKSEIYEDESRSAAPPEKSHGNFTREEALTTLGLNAAANNQQIKAAYHTLVKQFHPDVVGSAAARDDRIIRKAVEMFCKVQAAYETLVEIESASNKSS